MTNPSPADELLAVARLVRPHGIRGEVSADVLVPPILDPADLLVGKRFRLRPAENKLQASKLESPKDTEKDDSADSTPHSALRAPHSDKIPHSAFRIPHSVEVESARPHQARWLIKLAGVETMDDAEALRGCELCLPRAELPALPEGWFWEADLLGCRILDARLGELGVCEGLDTTGPQPQLVLKRNASSPGAAPVRIPLVRAYLKNLDLPGRAITLQLPEGFPGIEE
jgi:16S rRNA processing protein RimM